MSNICRNLTVKYCAGVIIHYHEIVIILGSVSWCIILYCITLCCVVLWCVVLYSTVYVRL